MARYRARLGKLLDLVAASSIGGTITELAGHTGISRNTASAVLGGKPVAMPTVVAVSKAFDVKPTELFDMTEADE